MRWIVLTSVLCAGVLWTEGVMSAQNRCADCHFANPVPSMSNHVTDWDLSAHSRNRVGCDGCHGGNPSSFEANVAHRGVITPANRTSPVSRFNVVQTCGTCHTGPFVAFQKSQHFAMLQKGDTQVPTCVTCHQEVGARLLAPKSLEGQCASCHGPGKAAPRAGRPALARQMMEGVRDARATLRETRRLIDGVKDPARKKRFLDAAQQAEVPLIQATQAGHAFVYDDLEERLATAQRRIAFLRVEVSNPPQR